MTKAWVEKIDRLGKRTLYDDWILKWCVPVPSLQETRIPAMTVMCARLMRDSCRAEQSKFRVVFDDPIIQACFDAANPDNTIENHPTIIEEVVDADRT